MRISWVLLTDACRGLRKNQVSNLHRTAVTVLYKGVVVVAHEFWMLVLQGVEHSHHVLVDSPHLCIHLPMAYEWLQEVKHLTHEAMQHRPALLLPHLQELGHEEAVANKLEPGECEAWNAEGVRLVEQVAERHQHLEVDLLHGWICTAGLQKQCQQDAEVRTLVEPLLMGLCLTHDGLANGVQRTLQHLHLVTEAHHRCDQPSIVVDAGEVELLIVILLFGCRRRGSSGSLRSSINTLHCMLAGDAQESLARLVGCQMCSEDASLAQALKEVGDELLGCPSATLQLTLTSSLHHLEPLIIQADDCRFRRVWASTATTLVLLQSLHEAGGQALSAPCLPRLILELFQELHHALHCLGLHDRQVLLLSLGSCLGVKTMHVLDCRPHFARSNDSLPDQELVEQQQHEVHIARVEAHHTVLHPCVKPLPHEALKIGEIQELASNQATDHVDIEDASAYDLLNTREHSPVEILAQSLLQDVQDG
mmetsp:Transcript_50282/g.119557  ORF Transcript_50282/g.119557 Transcript_50282/m.119557 type:complete len:479 (-) Transcript_50282:396-1832(-)